MFKIPDLPYSYNALEPIISEEIMILHHTKHHQGYVDKLNKSLTIEGDVNNSDIVELLRGLNEISEGGRLSVRNNGGGHYNHSLFWKIMKPVGVSTKASDELNKALVDKYGSMSQFIDQFNAAALGLFGSGWVWLTSNLDIVAMPNQDNPIMNGGREPILGLDIWEHAYYLDYKNRRDDYIKNWWGLVNWSVVSERYIEFR